MCAAIVVTGLFVASILTDISRRLDEISRSIRNNHEDMATKVQGLSDDMQNSITLLGMDLAPRPDAYDYDVDPHYVPPSG